MTIKQWTGLLLSCCLTWSIGCSSNEPVKTQNKPTQNNASSNGTAKSSGMFEGTGQFIAGTINGTGQVIGSTFNAADNLVRDTFSLIPFVDIRKAKDQADPQQSKSFRDSFPIATHDMLRMGLQVHWASNLDVPATEKISQWAVLDGGYLITVETPSNLFTVINLDDGSIVWRQIHGQHTDKFFQPFRYGNLICVNTETQLLKLDLKTGTAKEIAELKVVVNNAPAVVNNLAVFGGLSGRIFAHNLNAGFPKWNYQMQAGITAQPTATDSSVLVCDSSGVYIFLEAKTGQTAWKGRTFRQISASSTISLKHDIALIPGEDQTLYALDLLFGQDRWRYHAIRSLNQKPLIMGDMVLLPITGYGLYALDIKTGKPLWNTTEVIHPFDHDDQAIYAYQANSLWILDKETGAVISQTPTDELQDIISLGNKQMLLITKTGRLLKLQR